MKILVINAGSSSLKFQLIDMDDESVKAKGLVERIGIEGTHFKQTVLGTDKVIEFTRNMKDHTEAISAVLSALTDKDNGAITSLDEIGACGHRVLHGGETFKNSVLVTEETMKGIAARTAASAGEHRGHQGLPGGHAEQAERRGFRYGLPPDDAQEGVPLRRAI